MSAKRQTDAPFAEALSELKRERGLSFRELHEATQAADPTGRGISGAHISRLCNGLDPPSSGTVALIARSFASAARILRRVPPRRGARAIR